MVSYGTSAMSQEQIAGQLVGDEAYAGRAQLRDARRGGQRASSATPTSARPTTRLGAVKLLVATLTPKGSLIPSNARGRVDLHAPRGIEIADVRDHDEPVFTGNVDLAALEALLAERKAAVVGVQCFADGQHPFSLANLRAVRAIADRHGLRLVLDVSRVIENAWYIQRHEAGQADRTIADIVKQIAKTAHVVLLDGAQDPKSQHRRPPRHRQPGRPRALHERGRASTRGSTPTAAWPGARWRSSRAASPRCATRPRCSG